MITRRGLIGMFAAGVGAAVLPSGIIMPIRSVIAPAGIIDLSSARQTYADFIEHADTAAVLKLFSGVRGSGKQTLLARIGMTLAGGAINSNEDTDLRLNTPHLQSENLVNLFITLNA